MGSIAYVRMAPPDYNTIQAVSVVLDESRNRIGYMGTIFPIEQIEIIEESGK